METRTCKWCKGSGKRLRFDGDERSCLQCEGRGTFGTPDYEKILKDIICTKGVNKGRLLKSRPSESKGPRSYFIWRLARFHGGADVCLPICAQMDIEGDPFEPELNKLAEEVAKRSFGTDMAAAHRWAGALGLSIPRVEGLPASAYEGGPAGTSIGGLGDSPEYHADKHD